MDPFSIVIDIAGAVLGKIVTDVILKGKKYASVEDVQDQLKVELDHHSSQIGRDMDQFRDMVMKEISIILMRDKGFRQVRDRIELAPLSIDNDRDKAQKVNYRLDELKRVIEVRRGELTATSFAETQKLSPNQDATRKTGSNRESIDPSAVTRRIVRDAVVKTPNDPTPGDSVDPNAPTIMLSENTTDSRVTVEWESDSDLPTNPTDNVLGVLRPEFEELLKRVEKRRAEENSE